MDAHDETGRGRRTAGALVVALLLGLPGVTYVRTALTGDDAPGGAPSVELVEPVPWQAVRAGTSVDVAARVGGDHDGTCAIRWDDGTDDETVPATGGGCASSRVVAAPGMYTVTVSTTAPGGDRTEASTLVVAYDPRAGSAEGRGVTEGTADAVSFMFHAGYVPWRKTPAPMGGGGFAGPGGLSAQVDVVDWVVVTPERRTAVKGTAVGADGTAYGFVLYGYDVRDRTDRLRLVLWPRTTGDHPGPAPTLDDRPGTSYDLDVAGPRKLATGTVAVAG